MNLQQKPSSKRIICINSNNNNNNIFIQILKLHTVLFDIGNENNEHNYTANTLFTMF